MLSASFPRRVGDLRQAADAGQSSAFCVERRDSFAEAISEKSGEVDDRPLRGSKGRESARLGGTSAEDSYV